MLVKLIGFYNLVSIVLNYLFMLIVGFDIKPKEINPLLLMLFILVVSWPTLEKRYFSFIVSITVSFLELVYVFS